MIELKINRGMLDEKGLTISEAQTLSNRCNQVCVEIDRRLDSYNNYSTTIKIDGEMSNYKIGVPMDTTQEVSELLFRKAKLRSLQAYLMEAIKHKDFLLTYLNYISPVDELVNLVAPKYPELKKPEGLLEPVKEEWGWSCLSASELVDYLDMEAKAAHIGQFIHKGGKLDVLRRELPNINPITWLEVETGKKTPLYNAVHNSADNLLYLHTELSKYHHEAEKRVNYYKAKVKNLVTDENRRIHEHNLKINAEVTKHNEDLLHKYNIDHDTYKQKREELFSKFQIERNNLIKEVAVLRVKVPSIHQELIDELK